MIRDEKRQQTGNKILTSQVKNSYIFGAHTDQDICINYVCWYCDRVFVLVSYIHVCVCVCSVCVRVMPRLAHFRLCLSNTHYSVPVFKKTPRLPARAPDWDSLSVPPKNRTVPKSNSHVSSFELFIWLGVTWHWRPGRCRKARYFSRDWLLQQAWQKDKIGVLPSQSSAAASSRGEPAPSYF